MKPEIIVSTRDLERLEGLLSKPPTRNRSDLDGLRDAILNKTAHLSDHVSWTARQCYIGLGFLLESAALLKIDACPMEGILPNKVDEILGLSSGEYTTVVACALGYRLPTDKYASAAKVRFEAKDLIQRL